MGPQETNFEEAMPQTKANLFTIHSLTKYQSRACPLDASLVSEYAERYRDELPMAPIDVCGTPNMGFFVVDGHHRHAAMKKVWPKGDRMILVNVLDARVDPDTVKWLASGANTAHGLRRTNEDKRRAVEMALEANPKQSDRAIAEHVGVTHPTVAEARRQVVKFTTSNERTGQDGKKYPMPPPPPPRPSAQKPATEPPPLTHKTPDELAAYSMLPREPTPPAAFKGPTALRRDEMNRPIPEDLQAHFDRRGEIMSHLAKLRDVERDMSVGRKARDPLYAQITQETIAYIGNVRNALEDCMPYAVCPWCGGMNPGCRMCGNRGGFVSKYQIERFAKGDPEVRKLLEAVPVESEPT